MATNEEIFLKEFNGMMLQLRAQNGVLNLYDVPLPPEVAGHFTVENCEKVIITDIKDEFFSKLNGDEPLVWNRGQLRRHKYDYLGKYMVDKQGNFIYEDVTLPRECIAVVSDKNIHLPTSHKPSESFAYVDMISRNHPDGRKEVKYVYIVPRKYCYKLNQTALVLAHNKLKVYYDGFSIALKNGNFLHIYIIPYKPSSQHRNYRILHTKTDIDYSKELTLLRDYWLKTGYMFNPSLGAMMEAPKGIENVTTIQQPGVLDDYVRFDMSKSLGEDDTDFSFDTDEGVEFDA